MFIRYLRSIATMFIRYFAFQIFCSMLILPTLFVMPYVLNFLSPTLRYVIRVVKNVNFLMPSASCLNLTDSTWRKVDWSTPSLRWDCLRRKLARVLFSKPFWFPLFLDESKNDAAAAEIIERSLLLFWFFHPLLCRLLMHLQKVAKSSSSTQIFLQRDSFMRKQRKTNNLTCIQFPSSCAFENIPSQRRALWCGFCGLFRTVDCSVSYLFSFPSVNNHITGKNQPFCFI